MINSLSICSYSVPLVYCALHFLVFLFPKALHCLGALVKSRLSPFPCAQWTSPTKNVIIFMILRIRQCYCKGLCSNVVWRNILFLMSIFLAFRSSITHHRGSASNTFGPAPHFLPNPSVLLHLSSTGRLLLLSACMCVRLDWLTVYVHGNSFIEAEHPWPTETERHDEIRQKADNSLKIRVHTLRAH